MWLVRGDSGFEVYDVLAGGPADRAGIRAHDVVVAVDSHPAGQLSLLDVRRRLSDVQPGATVRLPIRADPDPRVLEIRLQRIF
jgi:S1-C subfamily serine protease